MNWYTAEVTYWDQVDEKTTVQTVLIATEDGYQGAMAQLEKWYGKHIDSISITALAYEYPVLPIDDNILRYLEVKSEEYI